MFTIPYSQKEGAKMTVGKITLGKGDIEAFATRKSITLKVKNTGDRGVIFCPLVATTPSEWVITQSR